MSVVNITATLTIEPQVLAVLQQLPEVHRQKKKVKRQRKHDSFAAVILAKPESKVVFLVYRTGRCVCLGSRSRRDLFDACDWLADGLRTRLLSSPKISNIVYCFTSPFGPLSLENLYERLRMVQHSRHFGSFEPELSPALIYRSLAVSGCKALIFRPGKVNLTGLRNFDDIQSAIDELHYIMDPRF